MPCTLSGILVKKYGLECSRFREHSALSPLHGEQTLYACMFCFVHDHGMTQMALRLGRFVAHAVAHFRAVALDFACASHLETLLGAGVGFHFRHIKNDEC